MAENVLVPLDGSEQAQHAFEHALVQFSEATLTLLNVINPVNAGYGAQASIPSYSEEWYEAAEEEAEELFERAEEKAGPEHDVEGVTEVGQPSRVIVEYADEHDVDHIVIGSHGREGVSRILLGSVAETVVRRAPCPVTIVR